MTTIEHVIDYDKYLNCPDCKDVQFYCTPHKKEVDEILNQNQKST